MVPCRRSSSRRTFCIAAADMTESRRRFRRSASSGASATQSSIVGAQLASLRA